MSGRNISNAPLPSRKYRVDIVCPNFESLAACQAEDRRRSRALLRTTVSHSDLSEVRRAAALAPSLEINAIGIDEVPTLASRVHMRTLRINVAGALWQRVSSEPGCTTCTIIGRSWEVSASELRWFNPVSALAAFRADLNRAGLVGSGGWLFAAWHGEYDSMAGVFRLHLHIVCNAAMVPVIDGLRSQDNYRFAPYLPDGRPDPVYRRIRINRQALTNLPDPLTYIMQSFWPSRPVFFTEEGKRVRVREKRPIPEPYHSFVLTWLDRWSLRDITMLVGLRLTRDGLIRTRREYTS